MTDPSSPSPDAIRQVAEQEQPTQESVEIHLYRLRRLRERLREQLDKIMNARSPHGDFSDIEDPEEFYWLRTLDWLVARRTQADRDAAKWTALEQFLDGCQKFNSFEGPYSTIEAVQAEMSRLDAQEK